MAELSATELGGKMTVSSVYSIGGRLEVYAARRFEGVYVPLRIVSYNDGVTWVQNWTTVRAEPFTSMIAGAITGDSLDTVLVGRESDDRFSSFRLSEYFSLPTPLLGPPLSPVTWEPIGSGTFSSKPAVCLLGASQTTPFVTGPDNQMTFYSGVDVAVFGRGTDTHMYFALSRDGASTWDTAWAAPIGQGIFRSSPAAACSAGGELLAVFGVGTDRHMYWAFSTSLGSKWNTPWAAPIGEGLFNSDPAAACSADGSRIYVFCVGTDQHMYWAGSTSGGSSWDMEWAAPIGEGLFNSAPSANCSWDGQIIHVFARGTDNRIYHARSQDYGHSWDILWLPISSEQFIDGGIV